MRPLLNAPDTRLTTLQIEEEESSLYNSSFGDDPDYAESENLLRKGVCNGILNVYSCCSRNCGYFHFNKISCCVR